MGKSKSSIMSYSVRSVVSESDDSIVSESDDLIMSKSEIAQMIVNQFKIDTNHTGKNGVIRSNAIHNLVDYYNRSCNRDKKSFLKFSLHEQEYEKLTPENQEKLLNTPLSKWNLLSGNNKKVLIYSIDGKQFNFSTRDNNNYELRGLLLKTKVSDTAKSDSTKTYKDIVSTEGFMKASVNKTITNVWNSLQLQQSEYGEIKDDIRDIILKVADKKLNYYKVSPLNSEKMKELELSIKIALDDYVVLQKIIEGPNISCNILELDKKQQKVLIAAHRAGVNITDDTIQKLQSNTKVSNLLVNNDIAIESIDTSSPNKKAFKAEARAHHDEIVKHLMRDVIDSKQSQKQVSNTRAYSQLARLNKLVNQANNNTLTKEEVTKFRNKSCIKSPWWKTALKVAAAALTVLAGAALIGFTFGAATPMVVGGILAASGGGLVGAGSVGGGCLFFKSRKAKAREKAANYNQVADAANNLVS